MLFLHNFSSATSSLINHLPDFIIVLFFYSLLYNNTFLDHFNISRVLPVPVEISTAGEHGMVVSWKQFASNTPGVQQWILQYRRNGTAERNITLDGNITTYTLPGKLVVLFL